MKGLSKYLLIPFLAVAGLNAYAGTGIYRGTLADESALSYDKNYTLDLAREDLESVSMMAVYSSATVPSFSFTDGHVATGQISVSTSAALTSALAAAKGTDTITVSSNTYKALNYAYLTINGIVYTNGYEWLKGTTANATAISIKNAVNANPGYGITASTTAANVVTLTCARAGSFCNRYTVTSSTPAALTVATARFTGGVDNAYVVINGVPLTSGTDWTAVATATGTARSISNAIMANTSLNSIVRSTWTADGVVFATSTAVGVGTNYALYSSTPSVLTLSGNAMSGGASTSVDTTNGRINKSSHKLTTALPVLFAAASGTPPGTLVSGTTYYAVPSDDNSFGLASISAKAQAGNADVGISTQTLGGGGSFSISPLTITGTPGLVWQESNDGVNYLVVSVSSVTISTPYTAGSYFWDFGTVNARYLRLSVTGPTTGGLDLNVTGSGKRNYYR